MTSESDAALKLWPCVEARDPNMHCVFSTQHIYATDLLVVNTSRSRKNVHDNIFTFLQIEG